MAEIGFYHLTRTGIELALPRLLGRTLTAGKRALVLCRTQDIASVLDRALWETADEDWLPHGTLQDGDADLQPIWLTTEDEVPNNARFLFLIGGAASAHMNLFERVFDLFDGTDQAAVLAARERWLTAKASGHTLTYWQQGQRGWERKAG